MATHAERKAKADEYELQRALARLPKRENRGWYGPRKTAKELIQKGGVVALAEMIEGEASKAARAEYVWRRKSLAQIWLADIEAHPTAKFLPDLVAKVRRWAGVKQTAAQKREATRQRVALHRSRKKTGH